MIRCFRFRYALRTLVVLVFCAGLLMGWLAYQYRGIQRERAALTEIRSLQARMTAPQDAWIKDPLDVQNVRLPWWLAWGGEQDFERVTGIGFTFGWYDEQLDPETGISDREMRLVADLPGIKRLDVPHSKVGDAGLAYLASLRHLEKLDLSATRVTDRGLRHLAQLRSLKEVKLNYLDLSGAGIQYLARCPQLQRIEMQGTGIQTEYVDYFNNITSLRSVGLSGGRFERFRLHGLPRLQRLTLAGNVCREFEFTNLPALKELSIHCPALKQLLLRGLPRLSSLRVYAETIPRQAMDDIGNVASLRQLVLSRPPVNNDGLKAIGRLSGLEDLHLGNTTVDDRAMSAFAGLRRLRRLSLHAPSVTGQGLGDLRHLRNLESLRLSGIRYDGDFSPILDSLPSLTDLSLGGCRVRELRCSGHLRLQHVEGHQTELDGIFLEDLPDLRSIDFSALRVRRFSFQRLPRLGWLRLSILQGTDVTAARLCDLPRLEHLAFVDITAEGSIEDLANPVQMPSGVFDHAQTYHRLETRLFRKSRVSSLQRNCWPGA